MKKETRIGLFIYIGILCLFALTVAFLIWCSTPFFDMKLALLEVTVLLIIATLFATAMMASSD